MTARRCLVIANADDADPGFVGERVSERGFGFVRASREDAEGLRETDPTGIDLAVLLGSDWSVCDPANRTSVDAESALARRLHEAGVPVLGICYGAQLLAHALGGSVRRSETGGELGWFEVRTDAPDLIVAGPWFQWHADVFTVPPGAVELARSPVGPQAFRAGASTLALQFHPEVDSRIVARWADGGKSDLDRHGVDVAALLARTEVETRRTRAAAHRLVDAFLESCGSTWA